MKAKHCECCYIPMDKDPKESGSDIYCSYCYADGKLKAESMNLKEFKKKSYDEMTQCGHSKISAWFYAQFAHFAPYWKNRK